MVNPETETKASPPQEKQEPVPTAETPAAAAESPPAPPPEKTPPPTPVEGKKQDMPVYKPPRMLQSISAQIMGTIFLTALIFVLLPFTQLLSGLSPRDQTVRKVQFAPPPPPEPPPEEPPEDFLEPPEPPPQMEQPPQMLDISQLQVAMNPGVGGVAGPSLGGSLMAEAQPDMMEEISNLVDLADLDKKPKLVRKAMPAYPSSLKSNPVDGRCILVCTVHPDGRVEPIRVYKTDHPDFEGPAYEAAREMRYTSPEKDGQKVATQFLIPFDFSFRR